MWAYRAAVLFLVSGVSLTLGGCVGGNRGVYSEQDGRIESDAASATPGNSGCAFPITPPSQLTDAEAFSQFSWKMFTSLAWPVSAAERGVPDCSQPMPTGNNSYETAWLTYKTTEQVFLSGARDPGDWNSGYSSDGKAGPLRLNTIAKASSSVTSLSLNQAVGGWLIDQSGNPAFYMISSNETSYDYIRSNQLYNLEVANQDVNIKFPEGAVEVKASWKVLTGSDVSTRYYTAPGTVPTFDSNGNKTGTRDVTLGLVGLHIIYKAPGFPQWIWSTFEQVDNIAPPEADVQASFANPGADPGHVNQSPCYENRFPCQPAPGVDFHTPTPLSRVTPIGQAAVSATQNFRKKFPDTVWQHYELVSAQWPSNPRDPGDPLGTPMPNIVANTTMESYIQPTSSCIACHSSAAVPASNGYKTDFSFWILHAQEPAGSH